MSVVVFLVLYAIAINSLINMNVGEGEKSMLDNGGQRNLDSEEQKLDNREEPKLGNGEQPNVDRGQSNIDDGGQPSVHDGGQPNADKPNWSNEEAKSRSRKWCRMESELRQNGRKMRRNEGLEYTTRKGTLVQARNTIYHRCGKCLNKYSDILPDDDRDKICQNCWKMGDMQRQRDYIANHVVIKENSRKTPGSRRNMILY